MKGCFGVILNIGSNSLMILKTKICFPLVFLESNFYIDLTSKNQTIYNSLGKINTTDRYSTKKKNPLIK